MRAGSPFVFFPLLFAVFFASGGLRQAGGLALRVSIAFRGLRHSGEFVLLSLLMAIVIASRGLRQAGGLVFCFFVASCGRRQAGGLIGCRYPDVSLSGCGLHTSFPKALLRLMEP